MVQMVYSHIHGLRLETQALWWIVHQDHQISFIWSEVKWKLFSHIWLFVTPWTVASQAPLSLGFPSQEYRSRLPFPSPGDLPDPGIEPGLPALQADSISSEPPRKPSLYLKAYKGNGDKQYTAVKTAHGKCNSKYFCLERKKMETIWQLLINSNYEILTGKYSKVLLFRKKQCPLTQLPFFT